MKVGVGKITIVSYQLLSSWSLGPMATELFFEGNLLGKGKA